MLSVECRMFLSHRMSGRRKDVRFKPISLEQLQQFNQRLRLRPFHHVRIGSQRISPGHVALGGGGGEDDDNGQTRRWILPQVFQHLEPAAIGKIQIEDYQAGKWMSAVSGSVRRGTEVDRSLSIV